MAWKIKVVGDIHKREWLTIDDGTNHACIRVSEINTWMSGKQTVPDPDVKHPMQTKEIEVFKIYLNRDTQYYFPCSSREESRRCVLVMTRLITGGLGD